MTVRGVAWSAEHHAVPCGCVAQQPRQLRIGPAAAAREPTVGRRNLLAREGSASSGSLRTPTGHVPRSLPPSSHGRGDDAPP
eukprot:gene14831-17396_t